MGPRRSPDYCGDWCTPEHSWSSPQRADLSLEVEVAARCVPWTIAEVGRTATAGGSYPGPGGEMCRPPSLPGCVSPTLGLACSYAAACFCWVQASGVLHGAGRCAALPPTGTTSFTANRAAFHPGAATY
ncbi:hypothetical protein NDU88_006360 [Pleurodeles waltl]|uniref:Uncharacterized protein n=1 Tax=Pleurodeles waltl TaxID=8319 RepID=A0AAV7TDY4_PLEWA|nr:hypothetical protein NDU88_006360 [Pleurodeles waltl]